MINKNNIIILALAAGVLFIVMARRKEIYPDLSQMPDNKLYEEFLKTYWLIRTEVKKISESDKKRWDELLSEVNKRGKMSDFLSKAAGKT